MSCQFHLILYGVKCAKKSKKIFAMSSQKAFHVQSPIKICQHDQQLVTFYSNLVFNQYFNRCDNIHLTNNGRTVRVDLLCTDMENLPNISGGPLDSDTYYFDHFHFHWSDNDFCGSEHVLDDSKFAMEIHFVHYNQKYENFETAAQQPDGLAVVAVFCSLNSETNEDFNEFFQTISNIKFPNSSTSLPSNECLTKFDKLFGHSPYVTYKGSLTTSPYSENVTWILLQDAIKIQQNVLELFRDLRDEDNTRISNNVRPVQNADITSRTPNILCVRKRRKSTTECESFEDPFRHIHLEPFSTSCDNNNNNNNNNNLA